MEPVREFYGTLNGSTVVGRTHNGDYNWQFETSDNSHTWHVHLSFLRKYSNDAKALQGVAAVIIGQTSVKDVNPLIGLKKGDKGEAVKGLQSMLRYAGFYLGSVDGNYGSGTASALLACRKSQGSDKANGGDAVDGWAFTQLHKALIKAEVGTISKGATGPAGPQGPAGPKGVPGPVGPAGKTPTKIAITGDVIASS
jgi:peptidoglycan hydrolase-like protein with peptidoglycan-binding domain